MRYAQIRRLDTVNGIGRACSLFTQGCPHRCKNCFNQETWDYNGGFEWTFDIENTFISLCNNRDIDCVSILGGEPFIYSSDLYLILARLRKEVNKPIFIWSGYTYEKLLKLNDFTKVMLHDKMFDYLIDGKYIDELKDPTLRLRGSSNQRVIDIKKSKKRKIVLLEGVD